jgi:hypothetical protein
VSSDKSNDLLIFTIPSHDGNSAYRAATIKTEARNGFSGSYRLQFILFFLNYNLLP